MKNIALLLITSLLLAQCADNDLDHDLKDENFPLRLIVDAEEGGDLADAEDFDLEINFANHIGSLPKEPITINYEISDLEDDMENVVRIDKVVYEVETDDCVYERELPFTTSANGTKGTITLTPDADLGSVPASFEVVFILPGEDDTEGKFTFAITAASGGKVIVGEPSAFEYEVLDNDVAGEWELELETPEQFEAFKQIFGAINTDLDNTDFKDITGKVTVEFEFEEMNLIVELKEEEEITTCEDGETETEVENKVIEIEAEYEAEDEDLVIEGSHFILGDDGEVEDELDFIIESSYTQEDDDLTISFTKVVDEDNFKEGKELFNKKQGVSFTFNKD